MKKIKLFDREFSLSISSEEIQKSIAEVALRLNKDLSGKEVVFVAVLNGAFMFAADLLKLIEFETKISFVKVASYEGTISTGNVKELIGINEEIKGKTVVILEDIVDSGVTMETIVEKLNEFEPAEIKIATLIFKPDAYKKSLNIDYVGISIPNDFIVGYGLDYNGFGRNLADIYTVIE